MNNILSNPTKEGYYLIDVTTCAADGVTILESFSEYVQIKPNLLAVVSGKLIGNELSNSANTDSKRALFYLKLTTILPIP